MAIENTTPAAKNSKGYAFQFTNKAGEVKTLQGVFLNISEQNTLYTEGIDAQQFIEWLLLKAAKKGMTVQLIETGGKKEATGFFD